MGRLIRRLAADRAQPARVLDVGAALVNRSYRHTYREHVPPAWAYVGCDLAPGENVDVVQPAPYTLPFDDASFDLVISGQVLEHVEEPARLVREMGRVLRPGGMVILTAPWRWEIHRYPLDCWRILPDGMAALLRTAGLDILETYIVERDCWGIGRKPEARPMGDRERSASFERRAAGSDAEAGPAGPAHRPAACVYTLDPDGVHCRLEIMRRRKLGQQVEIVDLRAPLRLQAFLLHHAAAFLPEVIVEVDGRLVLPRCPYRGDQPCRGSN